MKTVDLHQVDAFTKTLFGGNPAGVVINADYISDDNMQHIAREMNVSETAFVLKPTTPEADIKLRYFTPSTEVKFCGHATVGALYELARLKLHGLDNQRRYNIRVETNVGILSMYTEPGVGGDAEVTFTAPKTNLINYKLQGSDFAGKMGIPFESIQPGSKILIDSELKYIYVPIVSLKYLGELNFDFANLRQKFNDEDVVVFCLYTNEAFSEDAQLHARGLAPLVDVDEDPFTGSMQAGLFESAKLNGLLLHNSTMAVVEQGNFMGRPGIAKVTKNGSDINITGSGVHVFSTSLDLA